MKSNRSLAFQFASNGKFISGHFQEKYSIPPKFNFFRKMHICRELKKSKKSSFTEVNRYVERDSRGLHKFTEIYEIHEDSRGLKVFSGTAVYRKIQRDSSDLK